MILEKHLPGAYFFKRFVHNKVKISFSTVSIIKNQYNVDQLEKRWVYSNQNTSQVTESKFVLNCCNVKYNIFVLLIYPQILSKYERNANLVLFQ